jgi:hypothetical protein
MHRRRLSRRWSQTHPEQELPSNYRILPILPVPLKFLISLFWLGCATALLSPFSSLGAVGLFGYSYTASYVSCYKYILNVYDTYDSSILATMISL